MPFWTKAAPSGCPFPHINASLGDAAEVDKKPNFIEFYEISRSLHSDKCIFGKGVTRTFRLRRRPVQEDLHRDRLQRKATGRVYASVRFRPAPPLFKPLQTNGQHSVWGFPAGAASDGFQPVVRRPSRLVTTESVPSGRRSPTQKPSFLSIRRILNTWPKTRFRYVTVTTPECG